MVKPSDNAFIGSRWNDTLFQTDKGLALVSALIDHEDTELDEDARTGLFLLLASLRHALSTAGDQVDVAIRQKKRGNQDKHRRAQARQSQGGR